MTARKTSSTPGPRPKSRSTSSSARADRVAALRREQAARERRRGIIIWSVAAVVILGITAAVAIPVVLEARNRPSLDTVVSSTPTREHVQTAVTYDSTPPAGGNHAGVWLNCGPYTAPVRNEFAVHSLEHGAVWITYRPDLPADQVASLTQALPPTYAILSPFENLPAPVVVSSWGKQLALESASDPRLPEFIRAYRQGPDTPEPGAACTGGTNGTSGPSGM